MLLLLRLFPDNDDDKFTEAERADVKDEANRADVGKAAAVVATSSAELDDDEVMAEVEAEAEGSGSKGAKGREATSEERLRLLRRADSGTIDEDGAVDAASPEKIPKEHTPCKPCQQNDWGQ